MIIVKAGSDNAFEISINRNITFPLKYLKIIVTKKNPVFSLLHTPLSLILCVKSNRTFGLVSGITFIQIDFCQILVLSTCAAKFCDRIFIRVDVQFKLFAHGKQKLH